MYAAHSIVRAHLTANTHTAPHLLVNSGPTQQNSFAARSITRAHMKANAHRATQQKRKLLHTNRHVLT